jgi:hypothetical protein
MKNNIFYNEGGNATPHWQVGQLEKGKKISRNIRLQCNSIVMFIMATLIFQGNEKNPIIVKSPDIEYDGTFNATGPEKIMNGQ